MSDPADPGGETKYGISKHSYPSLDIAALTVDDAKAIYKRDFWHYDSIQDQAVGAKVFDLAVNMGTRAAVKILQQALVNCDQDVAPDGILGPATIAACNADDPQRLLVEVKREAIIHYQELVAEHPALVKFLAGWEKRAMS